MGAARRASEEGSDGDLIARYRSGDAEALGTLVSRYRRLLYGVVLNMVAGRDDAEEIFQEVWFRVIRNIASFREKSFRAWLLRIAHNLVIDRCRKKKAAFSLDEEMEDGGRLADAIPDGAPDAVRLMETKDVSGGIERAVAMLPEEQKEVFLMRVKSDLPFREIARIQNVSINTALARMHYAVAKLRVLLAADTGRNGS